MTNEESRTTADRILDAAEEVFAQQGYFAASIRGIAKVAGVEFSLAHYHFGTKDVIFRAVVSRRADGICDMLDQSLALASRSPSAMSIEGVIEAMVGPAIDCLASQDPGWENYLRLLGGLGTIAGRPDLLDPWRDRYVPTVARYEQALHEALGHEFPGFDPQCVAWGLHFLQCLLGHGLLDLGVTRYVGGKADEATDWVALRRHLVWHVAGGLRAQCLSSATLRGA